MLWLRKIVFYIFAATYLILCPLIVARMLGFTINPQTHHMVKTGLIYVSTNPPDASVYIDGGLVRQKTPTAIRDLTPGEHFIRIALSGYNDWVRNIPVVGKKATVLANTLLIPEQWPIKTISENSYQNIYIAADDILVATNPVLKDIDIFHTTQGITENFREENSYKRTPLFSQNSVYVSGQLLRLYNAPKSPFILLEAAIKDKHKFIWINLNEDPPRIEDISELFGEAPGRIAWNNADNENIFAFYPDKIYRINIKDKAIYPQDPGQTPLTTIREKSAALQDKFLINDKNDLLIREGDQVRIYPKEDFNNMEIYNITRSKPSTNMYFEEKNGELFYLDNSTGSLSAAQILPFHPILNIPIPEKLRFNIPNKESAL
jgi:hypothetical protein